MKVYIAYYTDYDEFTVYGVFSKQETAKELFPYAKIKEMIVDGNIHNLIKGLRPTHVYENPHEPKEDGDKKVEVGYESDFYETGDSIELHDDSYFGGVY